jgi:hypothetical protein
MQRFLFTMACIMAAATLALGGCKSTDNGPAKKAAAPSDKPAATVASGDTATANPAAAPAATPAGVHTFKGPDTETLRAYMALRPGFATRVIDGKLWVFYDNSNELKLVYAGGELAKHATRITATPDGVQTIKAPDGEVIDAYLASRPGFIARRIDGYLWVFRVGAPEYDVVKAGGELAKHVTKMSVGGDGQVVTIKASDTETITDYLAAEPGV